jgi:hypothetical protein
VFFMARLSPAFSSYVVQNEAFCIERDASVASTGWHGLPPPRDVCHDPYLIHPLDLHSTLPHHFRLHIINSDTLSNSATTLHKSAVLPIIPTMSELRRTSSFSLPMIPPLFHLMPYALLLPFMRYFQLPGPFPIVPSHYG